MRPLLSLIASVVTSTVLLSLCAAAEGKTRLYVDNSRGDSVSVIDMGTLQTVSSILVGEQPHGLALSSDGKRLFVTLELERALKIVDLSKNKIEGSLELGGRPNQCAVTPDGRWVVVPIRDGDRADIIRLNPLKIEKVLPIKEPHNAVAVSNSRYVYISSMGDHEIDIIDLDSMGYSAHIAVGGRPRPFVVSRDQRMMYVALANLHGFVTVDLVSKKIIEKIAIPVKRRGPPSLPKFETPDTRTHGIALSPDERELWVTSLVDDSIYVYNLKTHRVVARLPTGEAPNWIVFTPDGKFAAVTNTDSDDVSIFDTLTRREVARPHVGHAPKRIIAGPWQ